MKILGSMSLATSLTALVVGGRGLFRFGSIDLPSLIYLKNFK